MQPLAQMPPKTHASPQAAHPAPQALAAILIVSALALVLAAGAGLLWFQYGAAVFFDIVAAGIAACF